ncbi:DUF1656 domain-containing protein [Microbacteriaceae bacterium K1510]|nr:DUF1656 domain-containing protein [Microbacteriaceae bacterium K1510]
MPAEIDIYGVYVPSLLALMAVTLVLSLGLRRLLARLGAYAYVWHRGLFDLAVYVLLLGAVSFLTEWLYA